MATTQPTWTECPTCGDLADTHTARPADPAREFGPGEFAEFECVGCAAVFISSTPMPEPFETY